MTKWLAFGAATAAAMALAEASAQAQVGISNNSTRLQFSDQIWKQNDTCGKESFQKFSDFTAEGAIKRDAYMRDCLRNHHLPPRNDVTQPPQSKTKVN